MNKKLEEYKVKANRITRTLVLIGIAIFLLGVLISIVQYITNITSSKDEKQKIAANEDTLVYSINLNENDVIYNNNLDLNLNIDNFSEKNNYKILINIDNKKVLEREDLSKQNNFKIELDSEGKKEINIIIYENNNEEVNSHLNIFYIKLYKHQFLDGLSNNGISTHFAKGMDDMETIKLLKALGITSVRDDIVWKKIENKNGEYDFSTCDTWINALYDNDIELIAILIDPGNLLGDDEKLSSDEEVEHFVKFAVTVAKRYPQILKYEILNEPNLKYITQKDMEYYAKAVAQITKELQAINSKITVISGATAGVVNDELTKTSTTTFIDNILVNTKNKARNFSLHQYDDTKNANWVAYMLEKHKIITNNNGGFNNIFITEYGVSTYKNGYSELQQSFRNIKHAIIFDSFGIKQKVIYNSKNIGNISSSIEHNYGIINYEGTPKSTYYALKNYYENTNGAEYIGKIKYDEGVEAYVYDKDGKAKIIAWVANIDDNIEIRNEGNITDIYGNEVSANAENKITEGSSQLYIDNVSNNYFYQAISNTATTKYDEFTEKFSDQISKVSGLQSTINTLKEKMKKIYNNSTLDETTAINLMNQHYNLGNTIIQAYKTGKLQIEYVKLSSMLDMLNDIGNSYEDLVTVSAKTRNANLPKTLNSITDAEKLVNDDNIEMIYPNKILEFSKDYYDKANYINSLEEENDIKTGLIISKNLHSNLLANWALEFANLYIDEYILNNPVEITYSTTSLTNQDVTATIQTNANITITNNSNNKTYTFTQNGNFTFEYTIKGRTVKKTATVSNIDKTAPTITGVENDRLYLEKVKPQVKDENLQEVKLYKNNELVQNYTINTDILEDGHYKIIAIDKANNQKIVEFDISRNPATITYSRVNLTNQDVTVTIISKYPIEVINNSNKNIYTFTQNGEFTFKLKVKGNPLELTATVNNIDKTPPTITGIENDTQYIDKVKPSITDENLDSVKLYLNTYLVEDYVAGTEISGEGFYKIVATDKAGNETIVEFRIMENTSKDYEFKDTYILNVKNNTIKSKFIEKLNMSIKYEILRNEETLTENDKIATGDILRTAEGKEYTIIVNGDINKDGDVNIKDVIKLRRYLLERNNLDEDSLLAADCNFDGKSISIKDLVRMRLIVLERDVA